MINITKNVINSMEWMKTVWARMNTPYIGFWWTMFVAAIPVALLYFGAVYALGGLAVTNAIYHIAHVVATTDE